MDPLPVAQQAGPVKPEDDKEAIPCSRFRCLLFSA